MRSLFVPQIRSCSNGASCGDSVVPTPVAHNRAHSLVRNPGADYQHLQPCVSKKIYFSLLHLIGCATFVVFILGTPSACLPVRQVIPTAFSRGTTSVWEKSVPPESLAQLSTVNPSDKERGQREKTQDPVGANQRDNGLEGQTFDKFSAAQMLSSKQYKGELLAQVHLHNSHTRWDGEHGLAQNGIHGKDTKPAYAPSILERDHHVTPYLRSIPARLSSASESLIQLASHTGTDDVNEQMEDREIMIPARFSTNGIEPHWPLLPDTFSTFEEDEDLDEDEAEEVLPFKRMLPEKNWPSASLVQASSTAEEQAQETSKEKDKEEPEETSEAEQESQTEKGSATNAGTASQSANSSESAPEDKQDSKEEEKDSQQEGSDSPKAKEIDEEEEKSSSAEPKQAKSESEGAASKGEAEEEQQSSKQGEKSQSTKEKQEGARESKELPSTEEESPSEGESKEAQTAKEEKKSEEESKSTKEEQPSEKESKEAQSTKEESGKEAEGKDVKPVKEAETRNAKPVGTTPQAEANEKKAETIQKKNEEEEKKEHQRHAKELSERATKLANIQRMEQEALLKLHMLGEGGPRENVPSPSGTSSMSVQDMEQHKQLEEATKTAQNLASHLKVQHELKQREMALKQKEIAHLNLLKHIQVLMQSAVSSVWNKLKSVQSTLKELVDQSAQVNKKFLRETDNRVLRPQEMPKAVMSEEERKREGVLAKKQGVAPLDCPVECAPKTCDNKPSFPTHCFKYDLVAGGGGFRTCAPFVDEATAACPESYTRCAMAAPVRGRRYELLTSTSSNPIPQALFIKGRNMHSCLRLTAVHRKTECSPSDTTSVQAVLQDSQTAVNMPPPRVVDQGVIFENMQIASAGEYKLCLLQFWVPPESLKGNVIVLGVDEIGTVVVEDSQVRKRPNTNVQAEEAAAAAELETLEFAGLGTSSNQNVEEQFSATAHASDNKATASRVSAKPATHKA